MDIQYEDGLRRDLLDAWSDGHGDAEESELRAKILSHRIRGDEDVARFHLSAISDVAQSALPVPTAHMILHDCYLRGWAVDADSEQALRHLELAIEDGSESARWFFGCYLLGKKELSSVLAPEPERALDIFRDLARNAEETTAMSLARGSAASYMATHFKISEISAEDRELIDAYADDLRMVIGMDHYHLALFYADEANGTDFAGPGYRKSRELLIAGMKSRSEEVRKACTAKLDAWGVTPVEPPPPTPSQKAAETLKATGMLGGVALILLVWTVIGLFLLSITAAINAIMIPVVLVAVVVGVVLSLVRRG